MKDKIAVSWQVVPTAIARMISDPDERKMTPVMNTFIQMKKLDIGAVKRAYGGD